MVFAQLKTTALDVMKGKTRYFLRITHHVFSHQNHRTISHFKKANQPTCISQYFASPSIQLSPQGLVGPELKHFYGCLQHQGSLTQGDIQFLAPHIAAVSSLLQPCSHTFLLGLAQLLTFLHRNCLWSCSTLVAQFFNHVSNLLDTINLVKKWGTQIL